MKLEIESAEANLKQECDKILNEIKIKDIIIDFSCVNIIDSMGLDALVQVKKHFNRFSINNTKL